MSRLIAPSILSADFGHLERDCAMINESDAAWFHLDIMDGLFVPNISFGFPVCKAVAKIAEKPMDAHLMIVEPERYIERFAEMGVSYISVHYEACDNLHDTLARIHSYGVKAGAVVNPETPVNVLRDYLGEMDYALVMGVHPGYSGQKYIEATLGKVKELSGMIAEDGADCLIQVDGGVSTANIEDLSDAGASIFVAGSFVFNSPDPKKAISSLL